MQQAEIVRVFPLFDDFAVYPMTYGASRKRHVLSGARNTRGRRLPDQRALKGPPDRRDVLRNGRLVDREVNVGVTPTGVGRESFQGCETENSLIGRLVADDVGGLQRIKGVQVAVVPAFVGESADLGLEFF